MAHPTRFERVTFALREVLLLLVENYAKHAVEIGFTTSHEPSPTQLAKQICSWRKVEEAKMMSLRSSLKILKSLALPRGIEPLFQP
jgi:hypothetical protein